MFVEERTIKLGPWSTCTDITLGIYPGVILPTSIKRPVITAYAPASLLGGHSACAPPDPISNSAVKPGCADGTLSQGMEE